MREPKIPENEAERLADLRAYEILDSVAEPEYDGLTALAAEICEAPIALVSLVESDRQWFKSRVGLDATQTDRAVSFCAHAVADDSMLVVRDAWRDDRFADNPLVEGDPNIRFYAGALLKSHRGLNLGTLCVIDSRPRDLSETQLAHLETIARQVEAQLELRRQIIDGHNLQQLHEATSHPDMSYDERMALILETGARAFQLDEAYISRIDGETIEFTHRAGGNAGPGAGARLDLRDTYCALTMASGTTTWLQNAAEEKPGHPAAALFGQGSYLGTPIVIDGEHRGTLSFIGREPRRREFSRREQVLIGLYAQRISLEAARQREHERLLEQKRLLELKNEELNEANEGLDRFASVVAHDLRAPLRAIGHVSQWIEDDFEGELPDGTREHLAVMRARVSRMENLIAGILDYSRAGSAGAGEPVDLGAVLAEVVDAIDPPETIRLEIAPGLPTVRGDRTQLFQLFCNLIGNAIKYHDKATGRVAVRCDEQPLHWVITVEDDGPGIDPRYLDEVFEVFRTLESREERESTGVGLSIVRKIVDRAGGRVWIESDGTSGTAVHVRWPRRSGASATDSADRTEDGGA